MIYPHTVTFQSPVEVRTASGGVTHEWEDADDLVDLPARIVPFQEDAQVERMVLDRDRFTIIVQGDREVERTMRAVTDFLDGVLGVVRVERPVLYRSAATNATIVTAERIDAAAEAGS